MVLNKWDLLYFVLKETPEIPHKEACELVEADDGCICLSRGPGSVWMCVYLINTSTEVDRGDLYKSVGSVSPIRIS